jgi:hypothetical protein
MSQNLVWTPNRLTDPASLIMTRGVNRKERGLGRRMRSDRARTTRSDSQDSGVSQDTGARRAKFAGHCAGAYHDLSRSPPTKLKIVGSLQMDKQALLRACRLKSSSMI